MRKNKILDVRKIEKLFRKNLILKLFNDLDDGQQLELISDHSLIPLNKLFQKEMLGYFSWSDLEAGPDQWRIRIQKTRALDLTINDIIKQYPFAIDILEKRGIPYYKFGYKKLTELDQDTELIIKEIRLYKQPLVNPLRTDRWSISFTIDYIENNHHKYVRDTLPELETMIDHLVIAHSDAQPQLPMIKEKFSEFKNELLEHMNDEDNIVFPSYKKLEFALEEGKLEEIKDFDDAINWMEEDHILTGTSLKSLRNFCNNYIAPSDSSPGFKILFEEMMKFETDMHFHMHLENNILFTKVVAAIKTLRSGN